MDQTKPTVFLDIDGVLNSTCFAVQKDKSGEKPSSRHENQIDPIAVGYLNEIADWNFILSSTWRRFMSISDMTKLLKSKGFLGEIIGATPILNDRYSLRGNEIYAWMEENITSGAGSFNNYVIFDDDSDFLFWQRNNFIHIDGHFGIGPNHVYRAKRLLSRGLDLS